jgi:hypothetical protein
LRASSVAARLDRSFVQEPGDPRIDHLPVALPLRGDLGVEAIGPPGWKTDQAGVAAWVGSPNYKSERVSSDGPGGHEPD